MKFIVNSQAFCKQLQSISGVLINSNTVPIINCFHFHLEEGKLTVKATDLETTFITTIEVETGDISGRTDVAVPGKLLLETLKSMEDRPMTMTVDDTNLSVEISSGEGNYRLAGVDPETFPTLPTVTDTVAITLPASAWVTAINKTAFATSTDEMRPQMCGIFCELTPEGATFVSTDSHKMVRFRRKDIVCEESTSFILPKKPITLVKNALGANKDEVEVTMEYNSTNVVFRFNESSIYCRLVDGQYPNYSAAIPKENPNKLTIDRQSLLSTLRRVGLFANQSTHQVRLSVREGEVTISAEDIEFANGATEKVPCSYDGEPMDIGFNEKFLSEMVSNIDSEQVLITMSHPSRAGIIFPVEDDPEKVEDILMLVMPVMLAN
ncbi:MAG: DNA polymerase III subunit beta [Bacteroidales bacterium]|nr:DNA polymerase III subunit beta [Bacteroidales bacterium]